MQPQFIILSPIAKDLRGQRFGRLIALGPISRDRHKHIVWLCQCDCGNKANVALQSLRSGTTRSCGCLYKQDIGRRSTTHGMSKTKVYKTWLHIKKRCYNPLAHDYQYYGERGISVCSQWHDSFECFRDYVSELPNFGIKGYSLDRIDNNGNYEPGNIRWATRKQQSRNRRITRMLTHKGKTQSVGAWAEEMGIPLYLIKNRIYKYGWSIERALTSPKQNRWSRSRKKDQS